MYLTLKEFRENVCKRLKIKRTMYYARYYKLAKTAGIIEKMPPNYQSCRVSMVNFELFMSKIEGLTRQS